VDARWSEENPRRQRIVLWARVVAAIVLAVVLIVVLIASTRTTATPVGGDCGGKSCVADRDHDLLVVMGLGVGSALVLVTTWPLLVRRYRKVWGNGR